MNAEMRFYNLGHTATLPNSVLMTTVTPAEQNRALLPEWRE